jgi:hypothetical protein
MPPLKLFLLKVIYGEVVTTGAGITLINPENIISKLNV